MKISKALISVSDKKGLDLILKELKDLKVEIISTGGTYNYIKDKGYECTDISRYTQFPEILTGELKHCTQKYTVVYLQIQIGKTIEAK